MSPPNTSATSTVSSINTISNDTLESAAATEDILDASDAVIEDSESIQSSKNSPPVFDNKPNLDSIIYLAENVKIGHYILKISATDPDGDRICSHIANASVPGVFTLLDGVLTTARSLDFETHSSYNLTIMITDGLSRAYWPVSVEILYYLFWCVHLHKRLT